MGRKTLLIVIVASLLFIAINVLLLGHVRIPWCDEVWYADVAVQWVTTGTWETTVGRMIGGQVGFAYPNIWQMLYALWMSFFGISFLSGRMLGYVSVIILLLIIVRFINIVSDKKMTAWSIVSLCALFWLPMSLALIINLGRPEILCAIWVMLILVTSANYIKNGKQLWPVIIWSTMIMFTAIHPLAIVFIVFVVCFLMLKQYRRGIVKSAFYSFIGLASGFALIGTYLIATGRMKDYVVSIIWHSDTLTKMTVALLPYLRKIGIHLEGWETVEGFKFGIDIIGSAYSIDYMIVLAFIFLLTVWFCVSKKRTPSKIVIICTTLTIFTPLMMCGAGRYIYYYYWMHYIPAIIAIMAICNEMGGYKPKLALMSLIVCLAYTGLLSPRVISDEQYENVLKFSKKLGFKSTDKAVVPFCMFYEMKPYNKNVFFIEEYPLDLVPDDINLVITSEDAMAKEKLNDYYESMKNDTTVMITEIASQHNPDLHAYRIERK